MKQRVYKKNRDVLMQLDRTERIDKVEQTVGEVVGDYERLLRGLAERAMQAEGMENGAGEGSGQRRERAKRKVVEDEEDEDGVGLTVVAGNGMDERDRKRVKEV